MRKSIILLAIPFLLISCNKRYHVVGRVLNPITGEGFPNVKVEFSRSTGGLPGGDEEVISTLTDANGNYSLEYKGRAERIKLDGLSNLYELGTLKEGVYQQALQLEAKKTMEVNWHAVPYGELNINIQNINCQGASDSMYFRSKSQFDDDYGAWSTLREGCYSYTSTNNSTVPTGAKFYETKVIRSGITTYIYDTVYINESGVTMVELFY